MKIVIGIITHRRPRQAVKLVHILTPLLEKNDQIWIAENGSQQLDPKTFSGISPQVKLFQLPEASIPKARNFLFLAAKKKADALIFLDDDVIVKANWLLRMRTVLHAAESKKTPVVQGNSQSYPRSNIYAQTTNILNQLWLNANLNGNSTTKIIDTKHVAFLLKYFQNETQLFDPKFRYASDIKAAARLINKKKVQILFEPQLVVFHQERTTWLSFVQHRFRLSKSYQKVALVYPNFFHSVSTLTKFQTLWRKLRTTPQNKLWICCNLLGIYAAVWGSATQSLRCGGVGQS